MNWSNKPLYKRIRKHLKDLFYLPRADRKILFVFSLCLALMTGSSLWFLNRDRNRSTEGYRLTEEERERYQALCRQAADSTRRPSGKRSGKTGKTGYFAVPEQKKAAFLFDPNTADSTQLLALGFAPWQVRNIYKYRARGGRFHRKEDIRKIYGMTGELADHLLPLVRIAPKYQYLENEKGDSTKSRPSRYPDRKFREKTLVDLNHADTALLKRIPGIGDGYARMIVRYRERLGGFASVEQLKEIAQLPDSLHGWFKIGTPAPLRKIHINRASLSQLKQHPYLNFYQCRVILEHRRKYGNLKRLNDLSLYEEFSEQDLRRLAPYCSF